MFRYFAGANRRVAEIEALPYKVLPFRLRVFEYYPDSVNRYQDLYRPLEIAVCECQSVDEAVSLMSHFVIEWSVCDDFDEAESRMLECSDVTVCEKYHFLGIARENAQELRTSFSTAR